MRNPRLIATALIATMVSVVSVVRAQESAPPDDELLELLEAQPEAQPEPTPAAEPAPAANTSAAEPAAAPETAAVARPSESFVRDPAVEEIVVTATKRDKLLRDIPGSVSAIRGQELEDIGAQGLDDYLKRVPGVSLAPGGADAALPIIRGIATSTSFGFTQLSTGIFADDMPFTDLGVPLSVPDLYPFDLERVEVLKGPQGTLFGAGALAGAIRYILQKPKHDIWEAKLLATGIDNTESGSLGRVIGGAVNVPLIGDSVALRAVALKREDPGFYDHVGPQRQEEDIDSIEQESTRLLASWNASDRLKLSSFYFEQQSVQDDFPGATNQRERPERNDTPIRQPRESSFSGINFLATYDFDWAQLLSSTNRLEKDVLSVSNIERGIGTGVPPDPNGGDGDIGLEDQLLLRLRQSIDADVKGTTQEFRLSSPDGGDSNWEWLAGAAYMKYNQLGVQYFPAPLGEEFAAALEGLGLGSQLPVFPVPTPVGPITNLRDAIALVSAEYAFEAVEESLFGEVTRRLGEHFEVTAGGRYFRTSFTGDTVVRGLTILALGGKTEDRQHSVIEEQGFNPKLSLRYLHDDNIQLYALASKGFQFGGVQLNPPTIVNTERSEGFAFKPFKSSSLWNYEVGLRTEWLDRRLKADVTLFYLDWTDLQLTQSVPLVPEQFLPQVLADALPLALAVIGNVSAAHSEGAEISFEFRPFSSLSFSSSAAFISALTDEVYESPSGPIAAGARLPGSPRFQLSNVIAYSGELPFWGVGGAASLAHTHFGSSFSTLSEEFESDEFDTLDLRLAVQRAFGRLQPELALNITNLTDVRAVVEGFDSGRIDSFSFNRPRTALLTFALRY